MAVVDQLTENQRRFCGEYVKDPTNIARIARIVGVNRKTCHDWLKQDKILTAIDEIREHEDRKRHRVDPNEVSDQFVLRELLDNLAWLKGDVRHVFNKNGKPKVDLKSGCYVVARDNGAIARTLEMLGKYHEISAFQKDDSSKGNADTDWVKQLQAGRDRVVKGSEVRMKLYMKQMIEQGQIDDWSDLIAWIEN